MSYRKDLYKLGACCWLIADIVSDEKFMQRLRNSDLSKALKRLKETTPDARAVASVSLAVSKTATTAEKYVNKVCKDAEKDDELDPAQVVDQFSQSADYLNSWLDVAFEVPAKDHQNLNDAIKKQVDIVKGKRKPEMTMLLEWLATQEQALNKSTLMNKIIQLSNL